jgi:hypothetical protein
MVSKGKNILITLGVVNLLLAVVNILLSLGNQYLRLEVTERQQTLTQGLQLEAVHREVATAIAAIALKTNDEQLKSLLASQGISFSATPDQPGSPE